MTDSIMLIIIIGLLLFISIFIPKPITCKDINIYKKILLSDCVDKIKSGDLVLFSANKHSLITRTFGHGVFSHIGIILIQDNEAYIYEIVKSDYIQPKNKHRGVLLSRFSDRIKNYGGNCYIASLLNPLTDSQLQKFIKFIEQPYKFVNVWALPRYLLGFSKNEKFCSELISDLLNKIGISAIPASKSIFKLHSSIVDLCDNITYRSPIQVIPDNLLIKDFQNNYDSIGFC